MNPSKPSVTEMMKIVIDAIKSGDIVIEISESEPVRN